jgi:serine-type D-Ala-D-Ala carboxypeptidase/endopeptidase
MLKIIAIVAALIVLIVVAAIGYLFYRVRNVADTRQLAQIIDKNAQQLIDKKEVVGLAVAVVKGDKVHQAGYGLANLEGRVPMTPETVLEIGSISKVFTTSLAQLLVERGLLRWEDNLNQHLPAEARPPDDGTTLLHLATHTAGYPRLPEAFFPKMTNDCDPYQSLTLADLLAYVKAPTDKAKPDPTRSDYSNLGLGLLGHVLEWKTGQTYEQLLQESICQPLGMAHTSLHVRDSTSLATGHDAAGRPTCHWQFPVLYGAGAIQASLADLVRFAQANLADDALGRSLQATHQQVYETPDGGIAKGWHIDRSSTPLTKVGDIVWHNGGTGGFSSYLGLLPKEKVAVIVLANQGEANQAIERLALKLLFAAKHVSFE